MDLFILKLIISLLALLGSAVFAGAETAFMSLSRAQLSRLNKVYPGRIIFWQNDPDRVLSVIILGNNLTNAGLGVMSISLALDAERLWGLPFQWGGLLMPVLTAVIVIVFGEIIPKVAARNYSESLALFLARPIRLLTQWFGPLMQGLLVRIDVLLSWLSRTVKEKRGEWNVSVIRAMLDNASLTTRLRSVLNNLLDFGNLPVHRILVARKNVFAMDLSLPRKEFVRRILSSGYSRVPIYRGTLDNIEGLLYAKDLLAYWRSESLIVLEDIIRPILRVSVDAPLANILRIFRQGHHHMALVMDKNNRVQGLVTLQDVLEAIVGEMAEEA